MSLSSSRPQTFTPDEALHAPAWVPAPECPALPVDQLHIWRARMAEPRFEAWHGPEDCPVTRDRGEKLKTALFRKHVLSQYSSTGFPHTADGSPSLLAGPCCALRVVVAQCDHLTLIAVSRDVRDLGLDVERVRHDIPVEEMADNFLDAPAQWDLRVTWSLQEKAWKFFQFWTSNEARAQVQPLTRSAGSPIRSAPACHVRGFSPESDFIAALAVGGGPEPDVHFWDWHGE